jgi:hypothetical protein
LAYGILKDEFQRVRPTVVFVSVLQNGEAQSWLGMIAGAERACRVPLDRGAESYWRP